MSRTITLLPPPLSAAVEQASAIPESIRYLRSQGYPQTEIARQVGADPVTVWRWELGTHAPKTPEQTFTLLLWAERVRQQQSRS